MRNLSSRRRGPGTRPVTGDTQAGGARRPDSAPIPAQTHRGDSPLSNSFGRRRLYAITCIDPRVDPADFLGLAFAEAIVACTVGGRVTPAVIQDVAYIGYLVETKTPDGRYFEAAIIRHTACGTGLLGDEELRHGFSERTEYDEQMLADLARLAG